MFPCLIQERVMSTLRKQMEADMALRALAYRTRETYVASVAKLARHYGRRPDQISEAEVQRYLLYLLEERKLAHSSVNIACSAFEFFYRVTLKRRETEFCLPRPKVPSKLPQILSREEVAALFETACARIGRRLLAARSLARHSSVSALPRRADAAHQFASITIGAWTARAYSYMSPNAPATLPQLPGLLTSQRASARDITALTLHAASVIVVASTPPPPRRRHDADAYALSATSHTSPSQARISARYKLQEAAA
jgi:hypothetical protein